MARTTAQALRDKIELARVAAAGGAAVGTIASGNPLGAPIGGMLGAAAGFYLGDEETVFPLDMVAIPAYQAYMIAGNPSIQVYIRAGETLMPTGGNVRDVEEAMELGGDVLTGTHPRGGEASTMKLRKATLTAYQKRYKKHFKALEGKYRLKSGKWKKNGFKACVKAAHALARKK